MSISTEEDQRVARVAELHAQAKQQLISPAGKFLVSSVYRELFSLQKFDPLTAREAIVMTLLGARQRAHMMRVSMGALRRLRLERGEAEQFEEFESFLIECASAGALYGHDYSTQSFSEQSHDAIWGHVRKIIRELNALSEGAFLNSGALLGVIRDKKLIEHDDDIDLAVIIPGDTQPAAALAWRYLCLSLYQDGLARVEDQYDPFPEVLKLVSGGGYDIDLFPAWFQKRGALIYPHTYGELSRKDVLPLKTCDVTGLPIPAKPRKMLAVNYGADWQSPNPYWTFDWAFARKRFNLFLKARKKLRYKRVLTYGTFDLFHIGHVRLLKRLSLLAEEVIVACSTEEFNALKGKKTALPFEQRVEMLEACKYVTAVIPEENWEQKRKDVSELEVDLFAMGDDWTGKFDDLLDLCDVVYLPRTDDISTTKIKTDLRTELTKG